MRELRERFFQRGLKINVAWIIGLIFAAWTATAFYITITESMETVEARIRLNEAMRDRDQQIELREELEAKARAFGLKTEGTPPPGEVLAPSPEAYLKEFWRMQHLVRPGESIASYPLAVESFPSPSGPAPSAAQPFTSPLEAWKALFGLNR